MNRSSVRYVPDGQTGLQEKLADYWKDAPEPRILEAGCGSGSNIPIPESAHVTGIDISQEELDKNKVVHEKIVGDLETYPLPGGAFDLVVCFDVLEHLKRPGMAMENMAASVKPGGLLLLAFPNVHSLKAVVAKYTPLWFHSAVNRFIYGRKAGEPGFINFPTVLDPSISPHRMEDFARESGFEMEVGALRQSGVQKRFFRKILVGQAGAKVLDTAVRLVTFGRLSVCESDCVFLFRKKNGA